MHDRFLLILLEYKIKLNYDNILKRRNLTNV